VVPFIDNPDPPADGVFEVARRSHWGIPNLYRVLAHAPELLKAWTDFAWPLRSSTGCPALRELGIVYLSKRRSSPYVIGHHVDLARRHGVTGRQLAGLSRFGWDRAGPYDETQRCVLEIVDQVVGAGAASEAAVRQLEALTGTRRTVEIVVVLAFYDAVCVVTRSLRVPLEDALRLSYEEGGEGS
jgi:4-carboxymuconolactone decarboxylase